MIKLFKDYISTQLEEKLSTAEYIFKEDDSRIRLVFDVGEENSMKSTKKHIELAGLSIFESEFKELKKRKLLHIVTDDGALHITISNSVINNLSNFE